MAVIRARSTPENPRTTGTSTTARIPDDRHLGADGPPRDDHPAGNDAPVRTAAIRAPGVSGATLDRVERAAGGLATRSVALMDDRLPWFRSLPAEQRSWVTLVAQAGISGYVVWARSPGTEYRITGEVFGTAPRDLVRAVSLRRTVELVRIAIAVAEEQLPALAADQPESVALRDSLLRYSREVALSLIHI